MRVSEVLHGSYLSTLGFGASDDLVGGAAAPPLGDFIPLLFDDGQSNSAGRAMAARLGLTEYSRAPQDCWIYWKPDTSVTDNGAWQPMYAGVNTKEFDNAFALFGSYLYTAVNLRNYLNKPVYVVLTGDGGTSLQPALNPPVWAASVSGENYDISRARYLSPAITKLAALYPGIPIVVFNFWIQGESDAANAAAVTAYPTNIAAVDAKDQLDANLVSVKWLVSHIYYQPLVNNEAGVNAALSGFVTGLGARGYLYTDLPLYPRRFELSAAEKGGYTVSGSDDDHQSYIAHMHLGQWRSDTMIADRGWVSAGLSENTTNTGFDPATIDPGYVRLQLNRGKMTIGSQNIVTAVVNDLNGGSWVNVNSQRFAVDKYKGSILLDSFSPYFTGYLEASVAHGTAWFSHKYSFGAWLKPASIAPAANFFLLHDIQSTGVPNNSRVLFYILPGGKLTAGYAVGGTIVTFQSLDTLATILGAPASWGSGKCNLEFHVALVVDQALGVFMCYVNGVLIANDPAVNAGGTLVGPVFSNYVNATNKPIIGGRRSGASTVVEFYGGYMREVMLQPVAWTQADILNLMLN